MNRLNKVCLLSLSPIADDPRVRRQGDALNLAGYDVIGIGLAGAKSTPPCWPIVYKSAARSSVQSRARPAVKWYRINKIRILSFLKRRTGIVYIAGLVIGKYGALSIIRALRVKFSKGAAFNEYWSWAETRDLYNCAHEVTADLWIANDWNTLPIAKRLAYERGGAFAYDSHEFAVNEFTERLGWRLAMRPIVKAVEGECIRDAKAVSAVSQGIADALCKMYDLPVCPAVIRNTPKYEALEFRPVRDSIQVLYHGILAGTRGLETTIDSVPFWRPEFNLTIRGGGDPLYIASLKARISSLGLDGRVKVVPPVPMVDLAREASASDIGFFALPGHSSHNQFALPNKLFEYTMAGLALCMTALPEMALLINQYNLGITFPEVCPVGIADAINGFDRASIDQFKRNSLVAARELCWEVESKKMLSLYSLNLRHS